MKLTFIYGNKCMCWIGGMINQTTYQARQCRCFEISILSLFTQIKTTITIYFFYC